MSGILERRVVPLIAGSLSSPVAGQADPASSRTAGIRLGSRPWAQGGYVAVTAAGKSGLAGPESSEQHQDLVTGWFTGGVPVDVVCGTAGLGKCWH